MKKLRWLFKIGWARVGRYLVDLDTQPHWRYQWRDKKTGEIREEDHP
jgi:hypothetical protein